jgi:NADH dehydrogenase
MPNTRSRLAHEGASRPRVVIVGAGFAGLSAAKALKKADVSVTLIDRRNHHLFQPLLYQVATAGLSPSQIATPIRSIVRDLKNTEVILGDVIGVNTNDKVVHLASRHIKYDYLILATGARHSYFGKEQWEADAPGLKTIEDATELRKRVLLAFERAEQEMDPEARQRLLTFVVIGGGPTGVEMAGAIAELSHKALAMDFRHIDTKSTRTILVESGQRVLAAFPEKMSAYAKTSLECLGVEVLLGKPVTDISSVGVMIGERSIVSASVIWAAGVMSSPAAKWIGAEADRAGRTMVGADLTVPGHPEIFVLGDCGHALEEKTGRPLPGLAPVAKQQGVYAAEVIKARICDKNPPKSFTYKDFGIMATIGRKSAIADFGKVQLTGLIGWLVWSLVHVYYLIGFRNRLAVAVDWAWSYLTFDRGSRLITGPVDSGG